MTSLTSAGFVDENNGVAVGSGGLILNTRNGGSRWSLQTKGFFTGLNAVCFADSSLGWAAGYYGSIFKTTDGGKSWSQKRSKTNRSSKETKEL